MKPAIEMAIEFLYADIRNLRDLEDYVGYPEFTERDALDRREEERILDTLQRIYHARQHRWEKLC